MLTLVPILISAAPICNAALTSHLPSPSTSTASKAIAMTRTPNTRPSTQRTMSTRHISTLQAGQCVLSLCLLSIIALVTCASAAPYTHLSYPQIHLRLVQLSKQHPNLVRLYSAQDRFSLPHVGNCTQFPEDVIESSAATALTSRSSSSASQLLIPDDSKAVPAPCTIWIVELSNFDTLPKDPSRPQWLVSGELHGDEVVGPLTVLAFIEYMVSHYESNSFARRMIDTRLSTLVPMTNAVGYFNNVRVEIQHPDETNSDLSTSSSEASQSKSTSEAPSSDILEIDPNRDFAFDQDPNNCMRTVTARALNELYRVHLYRVAVTFHGGTNALGYEWGDMTHCDGHVCHPAPDTSIMRALAKRMSSNAGPAGTYEEAYPIGDMGHLIYPVNGGMEDWGYGASWTTLAVVCTPPTLGGYPASKTAMDRKTKRAVTYLVETSTDKRPDEYQLGGPDDLTQRGAPTDGHVPRNVRLLFSVIDSLEPYVMFNDLSANEGIVRASWVVSGAFDVDATMLMWSTANGTKHGLLDVYNGTAGLPIAGGRGTVFMQDLPKGIPSTEDMPVYFRIAVVVDQDHTKQPKGSVPNMPPQSHLMGSRASTEWVFSVDGREIIGKRVFYSDTMSVVISPESQSFLQHQVDNACWEDDAEKENEEETDKVRLYSPKEAELFQKMMNTVGNNAEPNLLPSASLSDGKHVILIAGIGCVTSIVAIAIIIYLLIRYRQSRREKAYSMNHLHSFSSRQPDDERIALASDNSAV